MPLDSSEHDYECFRCGDPYDGYNCVGCWYLNEYWELPPSLNDEKKFISEKQEVSISVLRVLWLNEETEWSIELNISDPWKDFVITVNYNITLDMTRASSNDDTKIIKSIKYKFDDNVPASLTEIVTKSNFNIEGAIRNAFYRE